MAKTHLATKWADLLCDIYVENAANRVVHRKKAATRQRYPCLLVIFFIEG